MFSNLSSVKNDMRATNAMIHIATTHLMQNSPNRDIHRIMVRQETVTITVIDKEAPVSLFSNVVYVFGDSGFKTAESAWYRMDKYQPE